MKKALYLLLLLILLLGARWFASFTPPILSDKAVSELYEVEINGDRQHLLIRGRDRSNPVLLFLHGGPGMPAMYLAYRFQRPLEKEFVVVQWDQRASGKSYRKGIDPTTITTSQLVADTEAIISHLQIRFGVQKVLLVGHSHGSYLGAIVAEQRPDLVQAFVGIGQVANEELAVDLQGTYLHERLVELGYPDDTEITDSNREEMLFKSESVLYGETSFLPLILTGFLAAEYSLADALNVPKGSSFSSKYMKRDVISGPLMSQVTHFEVPVYMLMGDRDMVTPASLAREYFEQVEAPHKEFILFEEAAHFPFIERAEDFSQALVRIKEQVDEAELK